MIYNNKDLEIYLRRFDLYILDASQSCKLNPFNSFGQNPKFINKDREDERERERRQSFVPLFQGFEIKGHYSSIKSIDLVIL